MNEVGKSLRDYSTMSFPDESFLLNFCNRLIQEEMGYDKVVMKMQHDKLFSDLNTEQLEVYNEIIYSVNSSNGGMFFVYRSDGCGKTFL